MAAWIITDRLLRRRGQEQSSLQQPRPPRGLACAPGLGPGLAEVASGPQLRPGKALRQKTKLDIDVFASVRMKKC